MSAISTIFVDAMGGDAAPKVNVRGAIQAVLAQNLRVVLVGDQHKIRPLLEQEFAKDKVAQVYRGRIEIEHTSEAIEMDDHPAQAVRQKKKASINIAMKMAAETKHSAFVSAGNSGAALASAVMHMGRIAGVERPAIAATLPTVRGFLLLMDAGANTQCKPSQLVQFALMGSAYYRALVPKSKGTVGLLSNGTEDSKGTDLTRDTHTQLKFLSEQTVFQKNTYHGYIEGGRLFHGNVEVAICDGFTGNIVLKSLEGLAAAVTDMMKKEIKSDWLAAMGLVFALRALRKLKQRTDYAEVGGAPLIGVNGHAFIAHGRSTPKAIKNAILRAGESAQGNLPELIAQVIERANALLEKKAES
jgi:glycerol-3-phosphate acyltransferase PlsX